MPDRAGAQIPPVQPPDAFTRGQVRASITLGVISLMMSGLMPLFVGALAGEHRLSASGIGQIATLELLSSALSTGLAGSILKPRRLRAVGATMSLLLAIINVATVGTSGLTLMGIRTLAGVPEGVLLWMVVGLIARSATPERQAGALFTAMAASQLVAAIVLATVVLPRCGTDGGYLLIAGISILGVPIALATPSAYGPLVAIAATGAPPVRGWCALLAVFIFQASIAGASMYIVPLVLQAGLNSGVAQTAISVALAFEVAGGAVATAISGRVNFLDIILISTLTMLAAFAAYVLPSPAWVFVAASALVGFCALIIMPFIVPMTIQADPSRRTAVHIGAAQLLGGALGPVAASLVVSQRDAHGAVYLSALLLSVSLGIVYALNRRTA